MFRKSGLLAFTLILALGIGLSLATLGSEAVDQAKEGVFIHIKSGAGDAHSVLMGLQMARIMADSRNVLLYVDVAGIEVLTKEGPDLEMEPFGSSKKAIGDLLSKGVAVMACPGCMKVAGVAQEDLMEGVQVAEKDAFFKFTSGRILSLSY